MKVCYCIATTAGFTFQKGNSYYFRINTDKAYPYTLYTPKVYRMKYSQDTMNFGLKPFNDHFIEVPPDNKLFKLLVDEPIS